MSDLVNNEDVSVAESTPEKVYLLPCRCMYTQYWKQICLMYGGNIMDRTNTMSFGDFKYKTLTPIPELRPITKTFEQICDERVEELTNLAVGSNGNLVVMWSGGIDSTTALVSILKNERARGRLKVLLNKKSIGEYPYFYFNFIKDKLNYQIVEDPKRFMNSSDVNITGEIGDQLFGSAAFYDAYNAGALFKPYKEFYSPVFVSLLEEQFAKCPVPLTTTAEAMWWVNFSMKYQNVQLRIYPSVLLSWGSVVHFFDTEDFQLWSMNNPDKKIKDDLKSYKFTAKDVIYEYTKDSNYRDYKEKVGSLKIGPTKFSIDENWRYDIC